MAERLGVSGVLIAQIVPGSGADRAGLQGTDPNADQLGDIIVEVSQQPVSIPADVVAQVEKASKKGRKVVLLLVDKDGDPRFIPLRIKEE